MQISADHIASWKKLFAYENNIKMVQLEYPGMDKAFFRWLVLKAEIFCIKNNLQLKHEILNATWLDVIHQHGVLDRFVFWLDYRTDSLNNRLTAA